MFSQGHIVISIEKGADVATLVLTASAVVLTGVGVVIAVLAVWGFREIQDRAVREAVRRALIAVSPMTRQAFQRGEDSPTPAEAEEIAEVADRETPHDGA